MNKRFLGFTVFLSLMAGMPSQAKSGDFRLLNLDGAIVKWGEAAYGRPAVVRYAFATAFYADPGARNCAGISGIDRLAAKAGVSNKVVEGEAAEAFAAWESVANLRFLKVGDVKSADIVIGVQTKPRGYAFTNVRPENGPDNLIAAARGEDRAINMSGKDDQHDVAGETAAISPIAKSLICFNPEKDWKVGFGGNPKAYDLRYTFMHEIGHAIGLDHVGQRGFLMSFRYTEAFRAPQPGDVDGARKLYGPAAASK